MLLKYKNAPVAELADAPGLGPGPSGCRFNSCRAHHFPEPIYMGSGDLLRRFIAMKLMNSNLICSSRSIAHTANVTCHFSGGLPLI